MKISINTKNLAQALAINCIMLGSLLTTPAQADFDNFEIDPNTQYQKYDAKTYPGINCEAQSVAEIALFSNLGFDMVNANAGRRSVVCPVVRDNTENTNGTHSALVHVSNPQNRTTDCTLFSMDANGVTVDSDTASTSAFGNQTLFLDVDTSVSGGYYGITCELPNFGSVHSYEVREFLETDDEGGIVIGPGFP